VRLGNFFGMSVTDQIAQLVLQDPSISVRELAERLGYSEEKSVYYWLHKRGFRGIRAFKRAVLTGQYRSQWSAREPSGARPGRLPVAERYARNGEPLFTGETIPVLLDKGRGLYVLRYPGPPDGAFAPGDLLVVGPPDLERAEWVIVLSAHHHPAVRRVVRSDGGFLLLNAASGEVDRQGRIAGTLLQLIRLFKPAAP
jgi:hypothetical protein